MFITIMFVALFLAFCGTFYPLTPFKKKMPLLVQQWQPSKQVILSKFPGQFYTLKINATTKSCHFLLSKLNFLCLPNIKLVLAQLAAKGPSQVLYSKKLKIE